MQLFDATTNRCTACYKKTNDCSYRPSYIFSKKVLVCLNLGVKNVHINTVQLSCWCPSGGAEIAGVDIAGVDIEGVAKQQ